MRRALTTTAALAAGLWLACSNDYQEGGPLVGDTGGKCFSDGTCKAGLICLSNLCVVPPDSGSTSSGSTSSSGEVHDAGTADGPESGNFDAGTVECPIDDTIGLNPGVACEMPNRCETDTVCCPRLTSVWECAHSAEECATASMRLDCDSPVDCGSGSQCCFFTDATPTRCADAALVSGICAVTCPSKSLPVCDPGHPCANGKCTDRMLVLSKSNRVLHRGLCAPPN
jgi:hypothetical protein